MTKLPLKELEFYSSSFVRFCDSLVECLQSKSDRFVFAFSPHCDFQCLILPTIKKYSLLVKLNQHIKQLQMDRNSKEINLVNVNARCPVQ